MADLSAQEQDKRHLRKADEERRKAEEALRKEVMNLGRDRPGLELIRTKWHRKTRFKMTFDDFFTSDRPFERLPP